MIAVVIFIVNFAGIIIMFKSSHVFKIGLVKVWQSLGLSEIFPVWIESS